MKQYSTKALATALLALTGLSALAQNPLIRNQFSADPSARVFGDKVYVFPSHDILATPGKGRMDWFCMEDYHVFSSANLTDWTDHGMIVSQNATPWVKPDSYSMWAPDCIERNGKYYMYFPSTSKETNGFTVGVAIANKPEGPYVPQPTSIAGVRGIDPNVFIDKDGQAYLFWSQGNIFGAKLKPNMLELDGEVKTIGELPTKGLKEGPYMFERNGIYYMTYPHVENKIERLEYAIGNNPLGPFKFTGVIMDESPVGCWTNHHSVIQFKKQWYLFYHSNDYSPKFDKARSIRADSLSFNADGTIKKVIPSFRGVGVTKANSQIEIDRFSSKSAGGVSISFIDTAVTFKGWKTTFSEPNAWIQYNTVQFDARPKTVSIRAASATGATLLVRLKDANGPIIAELALPGSPDWSVVKKELKGVPAGLNNLVVQLKTGGNAQADWVRFD